MTAKKFFLIVLLILLVLPMISAQPPFPPTEAGSIKIIFPQFDNFMFDENFLLHFHVHDSNNTLLTNLTTQCEFHLFNRTGEHIIVQTHMLFDNDTGDFFVEINTSAANIVGDYGYLVYCNSTAPQWGTLSTGFEITRRQQDEGEVLQAVVLVFIMIIVYFGAMGIFINKTSASQSIRRRRKAARLGIGASFFAYGTSFIQLMLLLAIVYNYVISGTLITLLNLNFRIMMILGFGVLMIGMALFMIKLINIDDDLEGGSQMEQPDSKWGG